MIPTNLHASLLLELLFPASLRGRFAVKPAQREIPPAAGQPAVLSIAEAIAGNRATSRWCHWGATTNAGMTPTTPAPAVTVIGSDYPVCDYGYPDSYHGGAYDYWPPVIIGGGGWGLGGFRGG